MQNVFIVLVFFTRCVLEDITVFGNSFMLKKYNVTVQRIHVYNVSNKKMVCNTTIVNRMISVKRSKT